MANPYNLDQPTEKRGFFNFLGSRRVNPQANGLIARSCWLSKANQGKPRICDQAFCMAWRPELGTCSLTAISYGIDEVLNAIQKKDKATMDPDAKKLQEFREFLKSLWDKQE